MRSSSVYAAGTHVHQPDIDPTGESNINPRLCGLEAVFGVFHLADSKIQDSDISGGSPTTRLAKDIRRRPQRNECQYVASGNSKQLMSRNELKATGAVTVLGNDDVLDKGFRRRCGGINFTKRFLHFPPFLPLLPHVSPNFSLGSRLPCPAARL